MNRLPPVPLVLTAIVSVQCGAAFATRLITAVGPAGSVLLRLSAAALVLGVLARPRLRGHGRAAWRTVLAFGATLGLMNLCFYETIARVPIGVAVTIEFLGPLCVAALGSRRGRDVVAVLASGAGVALIAEMPSVLTEGRAALDLGGVGFGLLTAVFWGLYIVLSARTGAAFPSLDGLAIAMAAGVLLVLPFGITSVPSWTPEVLAAGVAIAMLSSLIPYSLELIALRRLSASVFGVLLSLEPAVAAVAGLLILGQRLTPTQTAGMLLVVLASVTVLGARREVSAGALAGAD